MQRLDIQHHSPEQVGAYLDKAGELLAARNYTEEERLALLPVVVNLLGAKAVQIMQPASPVMPAMAIPGNRSRH